jgi:hypothetical protein
MAAWFQSSLYPRSTMDTFLFRGAGSNDCAHAWRRELQWQHRMTHVPPWRADARGYNERDLVLHHGVVFECEVGHAAPVRPPDEDAAHWRARGEPTWYTKRATLTAPLPLDDLPADVTTLHVQHATRARGLESYVVDAALEWVVDMDLCDYDTKRRGGIRSPHVLPPCVCVGTKACCAACWLLAEGAVHVLRAWLGPLLGPSLAVFSGGKGVHLWFASARVRRDLDPARRRALADTMARWHTPEALDDLAAQPRHPVTMAAREFWERRGVHERALLAGVVVPGWFAQYLPGGGASARLHAMWEHAVATTPEETSARRWAAFVAVAEAAGRPHAPRRVALELMLPVADLHLYEPRHMIKAPFSLHASGSGRVALPLDDQGLRDCDPATMPTASQLLAGDAGATEKHARAVHAFAAYVDATDGA